MPVFGVTATGFVRKTTDDIRRSIVERWKAEFGENAQTDSDSEDGHEIDVLTLELADAWEALEDAYLSAYLATAQGVSLDLVLEELGQDRNEAEASTVSEYVYGDATSPISAGSVVSTFDNGDRFTTDAAVTLGTTDDAYAVEIVAVAVGEIYRITIDGNNHDHTATGGQTIQDIRDALVTAVNGGPTAAIANDGGDRPGAGAILIVSNVTGLSFATSSDTPANIDDHRAELVGMTSEEEDAIPALATTLTTIETPSTGWKGATNINDATVGRPVETDASARERARELLNNVGSGTVDAIADKLEERDDVTSAVVFENDTDAVVAGRPPHSFEAVVLGSITDDDVAQTIWDNRPAGIQTYGSSSGTAIDRNGNSRTVYFSRATVLYGHLDVEVTPGEGYPTTGDPLTTIRNAIVAYGDANLGLGDDAYRVQLAGAATAAVPGIAAIVIETGTTPNPGDPTPPLNPVDITVDADEICDLDTARTVVHT